MKRSSVVLAAALAVAGAALAQESAQPPPQWHAEHQWKDGAQWRQKMEQQRLERLTVLLDLTSAQRAQVATILTDEHARMRTAMQQVEQAMKQARAAHEAARKETLQRLSSVLSPGQMKKLKVLMPERGMMHGMMMHGMMMQGMEQGPQGAPPPPSGSQPR